MSIASVSLARPLEELSLELGRSFEEYGFAIVRDHGIDAALIEQGWAATHAFFDLPEEVKRRYHQPGQGGARGYTPFGMEQAKDAPVRDLKEFWHVGRELPPGHAFERFMPSNIWPEEVAGFRATMLELFAAFDRTGTRLLSAIAIHLGLERDFFDDPIRDGNSVMRLLHYPPVEAAQEGEVRAAAHEDINTITLLLGAEEAGLELLSRSGEWLPVAPPEGAMAVNIGDMLQRQTNGLLRSTTHRVVNPVGDAARRARYSMPFFLHFRPDYLIEPMADCLREGGEAMEPILAEDYLQQRLREIKLA